MAKKRKFIEVSSELREEIAAKFKVTTRTVQAAMAYETNSPSARLLRAYALNHGGKMYEVKLVENPYEDVITL